MKNEVNEITVYSRLIKECKEVSYQIKSKVKTISSYEDVPYNEDCGVQCGNALLTELQIEINNLKNLLMHINDSIVI